MADSITHYDVLQVSETASPAVIRAAYKTLTQKYHPDRYAPVEEAHRITQALNAAFAILRDPDRRSAYDEQLSRQRAQASAAAQNAGPAPATSAEEKAQDEKATTSTRSSLSITATLAWLAFLLIVLVGFGRTALIEEEPAGRLAAGILVLGACSVAVWVCGGVYTLTRLQRLPTAKGTLWGLTIVIGLVLLGQYNKPGVKNVVATQASALEAERSAEHEASEIETWAVTQERFHAVPANRFIRTRPGAFDAWEAALQQIVNERGDSISHWDLMQQARNQIAVVQPALTAAPASAPAAEAYIPTGPSVHEVMSYEEASQAFDDGGHSPTVSRVRQPPADREEANELVPWDYSKVSQNWHGQPAPAAGTE